MSDDQKMPERLASDGAIGVERISDHHLTINVTNNGERRELYLSEYNAWRLFGLLAVRLGIRLPPKLARAIKF